MGFSFRDAVPSRSGGLSARLYLITPHCPPPLGGSSLVRGALPLTPSPRRGEGGVRGLQTLVSRSPLIPPSPLRGEGVRGGAPLTIAQRTELARLLGRDVRVLLHVHVDEVEGVVGLVQHAPALDPLIGALQLVGGDRGG